MNHYYHQLFAEAGIVEVRHIHSRIESGIFDNYEDMEREVNKRKGYGNLYCTINRPEQARVTNAFDSNALKNSDITRIIRLPFDFDPVREVDCPSTDEELAHSKELARQFLQDMVLLGWPLPIGALSGNGYHLQYRTALPATPETKEMLTVIYRGLKYDYESEQVGFDTTVKSAGQILRMYGTMNRKGNPTEGRIHRESKIILSPPDWLQVTAKQIERLAEKYAAQPCNSVSGAITQPRLSVVGMGDFKTLDVVAWFMAHGLYERHSEGNKHEVTCPWEHEHSSSTQNDTIIYEGNNCWPEFYCHHAHCEGRRIQDVMEVMGDADAFCTQVFRRAN